MGVLGVGVVLGLAGVRPIPAIILAQALNGILLPFVAVFLLLVVNDRALMGERGINGGWANALMGTVVLVTVVLGVAGVLRAGASAMGLAAPDETLLLLAAAGGGRSACGAGDARGAAATRAARRRRPVMIGCNSLDCREQQYGESVHLPR